MCRSRDLEEKTNTYAAHKLREQRGDTPRAKYAPRIGINESMLHAYESGKTRLPVGRLASIARELRVPLSTFILPDDDEDLHIGEEIEEDRKQA